MTMLPFDEDFDDRNGAVFSPCGRYRYALWRTWSAAMLPTGVAPRDGVILWIMANPSTADERSNDPTVRRTLDYSRRWGFLQSEVCNVFAYRSTDPRALKKLADPVGPDNLRQIAKSVQYAKLIVCAWGNIGRLHGQGERVRRALYDRDLYCLGTTKHGEPNHPLYLATETPLVRLEPMAGPA